MLELKPIIRNDIRIVTFVSFAWSIITPYKGVLGGQLGTSAIAVFFILATILMEFLPWLKEITTLKSSLLLLLSYDLLFLFIIFIFYFYFSTIVFGYALFISASPYMLLTSNSANKFKGFLGERYPRRFVEDIGAKTIVYRSRALLLGFFIAILFDILFKDGKIIFILFFALSIFQSIVSFVVFKKYYYGKEII